jgi:hypothetical protein
MDHVTDHGYTGKAPDQMECDELYDFIAKHSGSCTCVRCDEWDEVQYEQGIR